MKALISFPQRLTVSQMKTLELRTELLLGDTLSNRRVIFYGCSSGRSCSESPCSLNSWFPDGTSRAEPGLLSVPLGFNIFASVMI